MKTSGSARPMSPRSRFLLIAFPLIAVISLGWWSRDCERQQTLAHLHELSARANADRKHRALQGLDPVMRDLAEAAASGDVTLEFGADGKLIARGKDGRRRETPSKRQVQRTAAATGGKAGGSAHTESPIKIRRVLSWDGQLLAFVNHWWTVDTDTALLKRLIIPGARTIYDAGFFAGKPVALAHADSGLVVAMKQRGQWRFVAAPGNNSARIVSGWSELGLRGQDELHVWDGKAWKRRIVPLTREDHGILSHGIYVVGQDLHTRGGALLAFEEGSRGWSVVGDWEGLLALPVKALGVDHKGTAWALGGYQHTGRGRGLLARLHQSGTRYSIESRTRGFLSRSGKLRELSPKNWPHGEATFRAMTFLGRDQFILTNTPLGVVRRRGNRCESVTPAWTERDYDRHAPLVAAAEGVVLTVNQAGMMGTYTPGMKNEQGELVLWDVEKGKLRARVPLGVALPTPSPTILMSCEPDRQ